MDIRQRLYQFGLIKAAVIALILVLVTLLIFKDQIKEHKVTRAKMEMLKRMIKTTPDQWDDTVKEVYDSMFVEHPDTTRLDLDN